MEISATSQGPPLGRILSQLAAGQTLDTHTTQTLFDAVMTGGVPEPMLAAVLTAMAVRGEQADELAGVAQSLRRHMTGVHCADPRAIDTCGTGGDGVSLFNVSTTAALIAAGAGVTVAKHGNHTNSRASGSADVLAALGVKLDVPVSRLEQSLAQTGVAFLYARALHPAMRHAAGVRKLLGFRTVFNLAGPLANPAGVRRQLVGCANRRTARLMADTLARIDHPPCDYAWVVCGPRPAAMDPAHADQADAGLCDLTLCGESLLIEVTAGQTREHTFDPRALELGDQMPPAVSSSAESADVVRSVLAGHPGPARNLALLNAAAAICVSRGEFGQPLGEAMAAAVTQAAIAIDRALAAAVFFDMSKLSRGD